MKNPNEEFQRVLSVVSKYALHNAGVAFSLKKFGDSTPSLQTFRNASYVYIIITILLYKILYFKLFYINICFLQISVVENIRLIHGAEVAKEILSGECKNTQYK